MIRIIFRLIISVFFLLLLHSGLFAQKKSKTFTSGDATVKLEYNMTLEQLYEIAREQAIINAIEKVFGTYVEQEASIIVQEGRETVNIIGTTRVKGEWLETKNENSETITDEQGIYIKFHISGWVIPARTKANLEFTTLNCPLEQCRTTSFFNKEYLYLYFRSPVNGYLAVFIDDGKDILRLLPYHRMEGIYESYVPVRGDEEYIFFSSEEENNYFREYPVDPIMLYTNSQVEFNNLFIVFARKPFIKPGLNEEYVTEDKQGIVPKNMKPEAFRKWLAKSRSEIESFQDVRISLTISKKQ